MRKHKRFKKILLVMVLIGALLGVQVMEIIAYASEEGGESIPTVQVSTLDELTGAIDAAQNGDVIGVTAEIFIPKSSTIGSDGKTVTIMRTADTGKITFEWDAGNEVTTVKNMIFDGNSISSFSFVTVYQKVDFSNCIFKNCISTENGGAVNIQNGIVNFVNCLFQNNTAPCGGHLYISSGCSTTLSGCNLLDGKAQYDGGAVYNNATCRIEYCAIKGNSATGAGGGVYNRLNCSSSASQIYSNTAVGGGNDIYTFCTDGTMEIETDLTALQQIYAASDLVIKGWKIEDDFDGVVKKMTLEYETTTVPDTGEDGDQEEPTEPDTGEDTTDPSQPDDSDQGVGETPSDPTTPDDSEDPSTPTDPGDSETPSDPSDPGEAPGDDSGSSGDNITTDTDNSSSDTNSTDNSDHSSIKEDNSVTNTNSGNTTNSSSDHSQRTEDNSSVTYNYYYPSDSGAKDQEQQQIVIHNYIQEENPNQSQEETKSDPTDNISIDAEGVDVSFEVKDGVYSISIKAQDPEPQVQQVQQAAEEPASETSMVNWYEIIKIGLLGAIVFVVKKK